MRRLQLLFAAGTLLFLTGCSGLVVAPVPPPAPPAEVLWMSETFSNKIQLPLWDPQQVPYGAWDWGIRLSDMAVVVRTNRLAADEAEALRLWREYEARALEQRRLDRGEGWQATLPPGAANPAPE